MLNHSTFPAAPALSRVLGLTVRIAAVLAVLSLIGEYGFYVSPGNLVWIHRLDFGIIAIFVLELLVRLVVQWRDSHFWRSYAVHIALVVLLGLEFLLLRELVYFPAVSRLLQSVKLTSVAKGYLIVAQIYLLLTLLVRGLQGKRSMPVLKMTPTQLLVSSYVAVILLGTLLLNLPRAQAQPGTISFLDTLFTSTSAVCVTGLITVDTATVWSPLGQVIILILFQIGGLGIMTYTAGFSLLLGEGLGMRDKAVMQDILNVGALGSIGRLLTAIIGFTFLIEMVGAGILFHFWWPDLGPSKAAAFSVFHAISAFCNAGFSLFSENLAGCRTNAGIVIPVAALIVLGGLGFTVLMELSNPRHWKGLGEQPRRHFSIQTKMVVLISFVLIAVGAGWIYLLETLPAKIPVDHGLGDALFQSITARTAGFNTVDIAQYHTPTQLLLMVLMFIGASPGSTGGGVKTVTMGLIFISIWCVWRGRPHTEWRRRAIPETTVRNAFLIVVLYLAVTVACVLALSVTEAASFKSVLFEELSAIGTVGLSLGLTPELSDVGKCIIILSMLVGRIGPLTFLLALGRRPISDRYAYPEEQVMLG